VKGWQNGSPSPDQISGLVDAADGLFVWAATACKFIAQPSHGFPDVIMKQVLAPRSKLRRSAETPLDFLYHDALFHIYPDTPESQLSISNFRRVFGSILVVKVPLTIAALQTVLGESTRVDSIVSDLRGLQTRVSGDLNLDTPLTPAAERFHTSFLDFIVDSNRCNDTPFYKADRFRIDPPKAHSFIAKACLRLMNTLFDTEEGQCANYDDISAGHRYAFDNWASHACSSKGLSGNLQSLITMFCDRSLSYWFRIQVQSLAPDAKRGLNLTTDTFLDAPGRLNYLRIEFQELVQYPADIHIFDLITSVQQVAVMLTTYDHPNRASYLIYLGETLMWRFQHLGRMLDLEVALEYYHEALRLCPPGNSKRPAALSKVGISLHSRFRQTGVIQDLDKAISLLREVLEFPTPDADRWISLNELGFTLTTRFGQMGDICELSNAIALHREALKWQPGDHPSRSDSLNKLGLALWTRSTRTDDLQDLKEAISLHREALSLRPVSHPERSYSLSNLAIALRDLLVRDGEQLPVTGNHRHLAEVISLHREALNLRPGLHPDRSISLNNLASALLERFHKTNNLDDVNDAISLHREALHLRPNTHPKRSRSLNNLGIALRGQFRKIGDPRILDEAISLFRAALELQPVPHPDRRDTLCNLSGTLTDRFHKTGDFQDSEEATKLWKEAEPPRFGVKYTHNTCN
jgi:tetratricopeptide (TPR) repeat protein